MRMPYCVVRASLGNVWWQRRAVAAAAANIDSKRCSVRRR